MVRQVCASMIAAGCASPATAPPDGAAATSHIESFDHPSQTFASTLDVLFVVDDSSAMAPFRAGLLANASQLAASMEPPGLPPPSLHVAVTTADASAGGALRVTASAPHGYLSDIPTPQGVRVRNYPGEFAYALADLLDVGTASPSPAEPLEAARLALEDQEFRRPDARLVLVLIAAQDDASPREVASYAALLQDPARTVFVMGIYPRPAPRLDALLASLPQATFTAIDQGDLGAALDPLDQTWRATLACRCDLPPLDLDPLRPGDQVDCAISATFEGDTGRYDRRLPACPADGACWRLDRTCCMAPTVEFQVTGAGLRYQPRIFGQCVVGDEAGE